MNQPKISDVLLESALCRILTVVGFSSPIRAICDTGAQVSLMTSNCANRLGLARQSKKLNLSGATIQLLVTKGCVHADVWHRSSFVIIDRAPLNQPSFNWKGNYFEQLDKAELADPEFKTKSTIDILFSAEIWARIIQEQIQKDPNGLIAQQSSLGWLIFGSSIIPEERGMACLNVNTVEHSEIEKLIRNLWEADEIPKVRALTATEHSAKKISRKHTFLMKIAMR